MKQPTIWRWPPFLIFLAVWMIGQFACSVVIGWRAGLGWETGFIIFALAILFCVVSRMMTLHERIRAKQLGPGIPSPDARPAPNDRSPSRAGTDDSG